MTGSTGFSAEQSLVILFRDGHKCALCGHRAQVANHRANRGHGGFLGANVMSNGSALCHECNGRIEADADAAELARVRGVKISKHVDPRTEPYFSPLFERYVYLDDDGGWSFDAP